MEYLMTYGWAILIIAVILGVLFSLGVFNPVNYAPKVPAGNCHVFRPNGPETNFNVNLVGTCSGFLPQYTAQFDGQTSYITLSKPSMLPEGDITFSAWVFARSGGCCRTFFDSNPELGTTGFSWFYIYSSALTMEWEYANGTQYTDFSFGGYTLPIGTWDFLSATINLSTNTWTTYANGAMVDQGSLSGYVQSQRTNGYIGTYQAQTGGHYNFNGLIANVQVYNATLSANEIRYLYNEGIGGAPIYLSHLVGWWPLNGDTKDYSGNGNDGTPTSISFNGSWTVGYSMP